MVALLFFIYDEVCHHSASCTGISECASGRQGTRTEKQEWDRDKVRHWLIFSVLLPSTVSQILKFPEPTSAEP